MRYPIFIAIIASSLLLVACGEQARVKVESIEMYSLESGSPDFRRMAKICFDQPLTSEYLHEIEFISKDGFVFKGNGKIRPAASDPKNPCILRNINQYVTRDSPPRARDLIERYLVKGNIESVKITVWGSESGQKGLKMDSKEFKNL